MGSRFLLCRPILFGIMSAWADKAQATHSFQQKFFQVIRIPSASSSQHDASAWSSRNTRLTPIQLDISNLGAAKQPRSYEALTPVSALPPVQLHAYGSKGTHHVVLPNLAPQSAHNIQGGCK